ncbi:MAG TPA: hypothetical protein VM096_07230 [Vicinamibacterales bacterium]|nr:hypothetical protein [Vicinamibacterales bacterium]
MRRAPFIIGVSAILLSAATISGQVAIPAPEAGKCSLVWAGLESQIEQMLTDGKIGKMESVPIGVTKPQRATIEGTPLRFAWKPLRPGYSKGFMESYKAEIAAYKLDRMLGLNMVPPIVERRIENQNGAAVLWIENTQGWSVAKPPQGPEPMWSLQLTRMKMFDLLIANIDRNQGNLIYDSDWHLFLIDHSRAFIDKKDLKGIAPLGRVDRKLWEKMQALTMESLTAGLNDWVGDKEKKALLARRDLMAKNIQELVAKRGEKFVFYD